MTGIKLKFDKNGKATVDNDLPDIIECFGGIKCIHCEQTTKTIQLADGRQIKIHPMTCKHKDTPVTVFERCPLGYWEKLTVPIGWQNLTLEERTKWRKNDI